MHSIDVRWCKVLGFLVKIFLEQVLSSNCLTSRPPLRPSTNNTFKCCWATKNDLENHPLENWHNIVQDCTCIGLLYFSTLLTQVNQAKSVFKTHVYKSHPPWHWCKPFISKFWRSHVRHIFWRICLYVWKETQPWITLPHSFEGLSLLLIYEMPSFTRWSGEE